MATDIKREQKKHDEEEKNKGAPEKGADPKMRDVPRAPLDREMPNVVGRTGAAKPAAAPAYSESKPLPPRSPEWSARPPQVPAAAPNPAQRLPGRENEARPMKTDPQAAKKEEANRTALDRRGEQKHSADDEAADAEEEKEESRSEEGDETMEKTEPSESKAEAEDDESVSRE